MSDFSASKDESGHIWHSQRAHVAFFSTIEWWRRIAVRFYIALFDDIIPWCYLVARVMDFIDTLAYILPACFEVIRVN